MLRTQCTRSRLTGHKGQSLVEFALALPLLLVLMLGLIDLARGVLFYNTVSTCAREGARYGVVLTDPAWASQNYSGADPFTVVGNAEGIYYPAASYANPTDTIVGHMTSVCSGVDAAQMTVVIDVPKDGVPIPPAGTAVPPYSVAPYVPTPTGVPPSAPLPVKAHQLVPLKVTVAHPFTPIVSYAIGRLSFTMSASSVMVVE